MNIHINKTDYFLLAAVILVFLFLELITAYSNPIFVDEPLHISAGYSKLTLGDYRMNTEAPPLINMISAAPLLLFELKDYSETNEWNTKNMINYSCVWTYKNTIDPGEIAFFARIPSIILALILGIFIFFFVASRYNKITAYVVSIFYFFHPMVLTHSTNAYVDFGFMFFNFFAFFFILRYLENGKPHYIYLFFLFFSLAFVSKFSALYNFIFYPLVLIINRKKLLHLNIKTALKFLLIFCVIFYLTILSAYQFRGIFMPLGEALSNDVHILKNDPKLANALQLINKNGITKFMSEVPNPLPYYLTKGIGYWMFDARSSGISLFETLKGILLKNSISMIMVLIAFIVICGLKRNSNANNLSIYEKNFNYFILFYIFTFGTFGSFFAPRYLLMIYPALILLAAKPVFILTESKIHKWKIIAIMLALIILHLISVFSFYPDFFGYHNILGKIFGDLRNDLPSFLSRYGC